MNKLKLTSIFLSLCKFYKEALKASKNAEERLSSTRDRQQDRTATPHLDKVVHCQLMLADHLT